MNLFKITLLSSLVTFSSCNKQTAAEKESDATSIDDVNSAIEEMQAQNKKELDETGMVEANSKQLDKVISATERLKGSDTDEARLYQIIGKHMKVMQSKLAEFEKEQEGLEEALDLSSLKEKNDAADRIKKLNRAILANKKFKKYATQDYYNNVMREVESTDLPKQVKNDFRKGFEGNGKKDRQVRLVKIIRDSEVEVCQIFKKQLTLLNDNTDKWTWNSESEEVIISDTDIETEYNSNVEALQAAVQVQMDAQRKAIKGQ